MSAGPSRLLFVSHQSRFLEKCPLIIKTVDLWTRRHVHHVWHHASNVHGSYTLTWTKTASVHTWGVKSSACVIGTKWEMSDVKVGPLISPLLSDALRGLYLCDFLHLLDFFNNGKVLRKIWTTNMHLGIGTVVFFLLKSLQKYRKNQESFFFFLFL